MYTIKINFLPELERTIELKTLPMIFFLIRGNLTKFHGRPNTAISTKFSRFRVNTNEDPFSRIP